MTHSPTPYVSEVTCPTLGSANVDLMVACKIPLLARALGLKARPSARATIGYLVY